ncbi:hypothetical protein T484DRAFT_1820798 [Baffinella frigidus]|nr:hypothetical protein T484DRAFT_1820798 [Cryptophyta sp. CCMP2293]
MGTGNKYERERQANIERNEAMLESLGLKDPVASGLVPPRAPKAPPKKRTRAERAGERTSLRAKNMPVPTYVPPSPEHTRDDTAKIRKEEQAKGFRLPDGKWRGERFG